MTNRRRVEMKCSKCKEQIEVGEACREERVGPDEVRYFHPGCFVRFTDNAGAIERAYDDFDKARAVVKQRQGELF
jgi:hypothetical protein